MKLEELEQEAFKLPMHLRARLAERLLASLDEESEIEKAWLEEVERRWGRIEEGKSELRPAADVLADIRSGLAP